VIMAKCREKQKDSWKNKHSLALNLSFLLQSKKSFAHSILDKQEQSGNNSQLSKPRHQTHTHRPSLSFASTVFRHRNPFPKREKISFSCIHCFIQASKSVSIRVRRPIFSCTKFPHKIAATHDKIGGTGFQIPLQMHTPAVFSTHQDLRDTKANGRRRLRLVKL
jgi:hypothetical protein